jgi:NADH:flavin oxidoreductase / NADH oxidase family
VAAKAHKLLFSPVQVGPITLKHRIAMAPMTRQRSQQPGNVPGDLQLQYYTQRASDGGLIIAEGTAVSPLGHGGYGSPGLWTDDQVSGCTRITEAAHAVQERANLAGRAYSARDLHRLPRRPLPTDDGIWSRRGSPTRSGIDRNAAAQKSGMPSLASALQRTRNTTHEFLTGQTLLDGFLRCARRV